MLGRVFRNRACERIPPSGVREFRDRPLIVFVVSFILVGRESGGHCPQIPAFLAAYCSCVVTGLSAFGLSAASVSKTFIWSHLWLLH